MFTPEAIVLTIVLGLVTTAIFELLRRHWNPVIWVFTALEDENWWLERTGRRTAFDVKFVHGFTRPPIFHKDHYSMGDETYFIQRLTDFPKGTREGLDMMNSGAYGCWMFWVEGGRRRLVELRIPNGAHRHEIRRRDQLSATKTRKIISGLHLYMPYTSE